MQHASAQQLGLDLALVPVVPPTPSRQSTNRARLAKLSLRLPSFYLRLGPTFIRGRPSSALSRAGCPEQRVHAAAKTRSMVFIRLSSRLSFALPSVGVTVPWINALISADVILLSSSRFAAQSISASAGAALPCFAGTLSSLVLRDMATLPRPRRTPFLREIHRLWI